MDIYSLPVPESGGKTCSQIFEEAGCDTSTSPSCGGCLGGPKDSYARMNVPQASCFTNGHFYEARLWVLPPELIFFLLKPMLFW